MRKPETDAPPKAAIVTLGCPMNQVDSERIIGGLVSLGFEIVPEEEAEVAVVNTCGFIESAREESIETILSVAELKRTGALKSLVVAGCMAERYRVELERDLAEADAVVGLDGRESIPRLCLELLRGEKRTNAVAGRAVMGPPHSAYLKIAEGCDNRCAYCAIPSIRGGFRSIGPGAVLDDARDLAALGARELILIAQDTANYGADLDGASLASLLEGLNDVEGIRWIRVLYAHPAHITDGMIDAMAGLPKV
ncbi:MAG: 30S ribosomal protein S12 methylthiotransferase RimO, partial [Candidatus Latescibacteria bacterium]|nr:30S ribosomal protein S12 methylthiotransferase RimO [Candidatus Latescibacterota bacterium]